MGERERARVMAALAAVDAVVLFDEDTPLELIRALKPNVLVKGGDYTVETVVGHEDVIANGGRVEIVPTVEGFSTTNIVKKLTGRQRNAGGFSELIIVTGGAGFIGSNLIHELNRAGERDILLVDNFAPAPNLTGPKFLNLAGAEFSDYMDKREFRAALKAGEFEGAKVRAILHQGACSNTLEDDGRYMMDNNFTCSKELLHFATGAEDSAGVCVDGGGVWG